MKISAGRIKKVVVGFALIFFVFLVSNFCLAQTIKGVTAFVHNADELSTWFINEFRYETEMPDYWQSAQETLDLKKGDCEDFALLTQAILERLGIASDVLIIKFRRLNQSHAICIFKNGNNYSFFSNQKLINTKASAIKEAIQGQYSDWEKIIFTNAKKQSLKVVIRDNRKDSSGNELVAASGNR